MHPCETLDFLSLNFVQRISFKCFEMARCHIRSKKPFNVFRFFYISVVVVKRKAVATGMRRPRIPLSVTGKPVNDVIIFNSKRHFMT